MASLSQPDWADHCAAVIPCFNEAESIAGVVAETRRHLPALIVVDDGSTDETARNAAHSGADLVRLPRNSGKGAALRAGWERARARGFAWVLMLDGDGQHLPADIPGFFAAADKTAARLVVGNRMSNAAAMPWLRRRVNQWMSRRISKLVGMALPDTQCGFRLAHLETLLLLPLATRRFEIESEMLVAFLGAGQHIEFVPVRTVYNSHTSKIRACPDTWRWLRWLLIQNAGRPRAEAGNP